MINKEFDDLRKLSIFKSISKYLCIINQIFAAWMTNVQLIGQNKTQNKPIHLILKKKYTMCITKYSSLCILFDPVCELWIRKKKEKKCSCISCLFYIQLVSHILEHEFFCLAIWAAHGSKKNQFEYLLAIFGGVFSTFHIVASTLKSCLTQHWEKYKFWFKI